MSMVINHNIAALNTYRQLSINTANGEKSLEKLSSGLRINRAGDDAAGLAISEKMRGQIRGLDQATRNSQDGISMIQTAEGALNETHSILQRMRELAVQSASDTNTDQDRGNLQNEMDQLTSEIDRIRNTTEFNTKKLLNGNLGSAVNASVNSVDTNKALLSSAGTALVTATTLAGIEDANKNSLGIVSGDTVTVSFLKGGTYNSYQVAVTAGTTIDNIFGATGATGNITFAFGAAGELTVTAATAGIATQITGLTVTVSDASGNAKTAASNVLSSFAETVSAADQRTDGRATFQIGANAGQTLQLDVGDMGATALGVSGIKITSQSAASIAVTAIDQAIQKVSSQRSNLGAVQNRLEHTINNLGTSSENLTAAESRVRDVDMAKEMMSYSKNNILNQAATAMLAQANQAPQGVLQLLR